MNIALIEQRLSQAIGLDPASLGPTLIRQGVERRMEACLCGTLREYLTRLDGSTDELQELVEELVVGESWFFRHPQAFAVLAQAARSAVSIESRKCYRVLSLPCAAGEEPYSIAIALLNAGLTASQMAIDAADVSQRALAKARIGSFGARALRIVSPARRARFFRQSDHEYQVSTELRSMVSFELINILQEDFGKWPTKYDAVFCRNLLIYLSTAARAVVIERLERVLTDDGLLFVGHAEGLAGLDRHFERLNERGAFAYRKRTAQVELLAIARTPTPSARTSHLAPKRLDRAGSATKATKLATSTPADALRGHARPGGDSMLDEASALANDKHFDEAISVCRQHLSRRGPSAEAYHVMGMILQAAGDDARAEEALRRAVYLDGNHEDSLLALSLLAKKRLDHATADRLHARARRANLRGTNK